MQTGRTVPHSYISVGNLFCRTGGVDSVRCLHVQERARQYAETILSEDALLQHNEVQVSEDPFYEYKSRDKDFMVNGIPYSRYQKSVSMFFVFGVSCTNTVFAVQHIANGTNSEPFTLYISGDFRDAGEEIRRLNEKYHIPPFSFWALSDKATNGLSINAIRREIINASGFRKEEDRVFSLVSVHYGGGEKSRGRFLFANRKRLALLLK